jgi:hypothetical protein
MWHVLLGWIGYAKLVLIEEIKIKHHNYKDSKERC